MSLLTNDKITEIFCAADEFCKEYSQVIKENRTLSITDGKRHRNRQHEMSDSEIITILILYHFGTFKNFKHYYFHYIKVHLRKEFPKQLSYNRFVAIECTVFVPMMLFLNMVCFGKCTGITFVDSTKISVCHNKRSIIETFNDELKNICDIEHSRHRSIQNFFMNLIAALGAYCFFDKKPAIEVDIELSNQLELFC